MQNAIDEMDRFLTETVTAAEMTADDDGLPFETIDAFSTDPIGFGELSERMLSRVELIFDQTVLYNRHSAKYLKACAMLERGIKYLGSACLTKIALEKKKLSFPNLRQLSTEKLYRMASFNFRKLDTALTENIEQKHEMTDSLLDMQFRYYNLLQRLRSTEVKINDYHDKMYYGKEDWSPVIHGNAFSEKSGVRHYTKEHMDPPAFRSAPAFPLLSEAKEQDSGQRSVVSEENSDQQSAVSGQRNKGGRETVASGTEGSLPEAENKDSADEREADNFEVSVPDPVENEDPGGNEVRESEPAGEEHAGGTEACASEASLLSERRPLVDPELLNQLTGQFTRDEMANMIRDPEFVKRKRKLAAVFYYILYGDSQFLDPWEQDSG